MLRIKQITLNMLEENCYIVSDQTNHAIIIDCGAYSNADRRAVTAYVETNKLHIVYHLLTHAHYDHCFGASFIWQTYGVAPMFHSADLPIYNGMASEIFGYMGVCMRDGSLPEPVSHFADGEEIQWGDSKLTVIHTPGHTPGGVCFHCAEQNILFTGDTLFYASVGRTDFAGGDQHALLTSIRQKLFILPDNTTAYPGHGPKTTIGFEKQHNPYTR